MVVRGTYFDCRNMKLNPRQNTVNDIPKKAKAVTVSVTDRWIVTVSSSGTPS